MFGRIAPRRPICETETPVGRATHELLMKRNSPLLFRNQIAAKGLFCAVVLLVGLSATAQVNLLKNGNFDTAPLGPTNWTVIYLHGGPDDYEIKDRATPSSPHNQSFYDGHFRPIGQRLAHACFSQTVTNLVPGHTYNFSGLMREDWWKSPTDALRDRFLVYMEVIGGQGTTNLEGRKSVLAAAAPSPDIDAPYTYATANWTTFTAQQTPDANGKIEVRLHHQFTGYVEFDKCMQMSGYFDAISLTY